MMNPLPVVLADIRQSRAGCTAVVGLIAVALGVAVSAQERALRQGSARAADAFDLLIGAPGGQTQLVLTSVYLQPAALPLIPRGRPPTPAGGAQTGLCGPHRLRGLLPGLSCRRLDGGFPLAGGPGGTG